MLLLSQILNEIDYRTVVTVLDLNEKKIFETYKHKIIVDDDYGKHKNRSVIKVKPTGENRLVVKLKD